jgi:hypothetical protein
MDSLVSNVDVVAWATSRLAAKAARARRLLVLFLHGYMSPRSPGPEVLTGVLEPMGVDLWYATAPHGLVDDFNDYGEASWFKYSSDNTAALPIAFDRPNMPDVDAVLHEDLVDIQGPGAPPAPTSLLTAVKLANSGNWSVLLCGESQGGLMAALLAAACEKKKLRLGGVFMLRSAPDPFTWSNTWPSAAPRAFNQTCPWGAYVGETDDVFPEAFVRYALSPVKARIVVATALDHYDGSTSVYCRAFATFVRWALLEQC